ncbi:MAG: hypothetical protein DMG78_32925 [Acidobacteria bacterium]|nr:MAG: hypothetical protein DMG78_32925 [Acidobacteriota bacterium]
MLITVFFSLSYLRARSVRAELAKLQEQTGLSLVSVQNRSIQAVVFSRGKALKVRDLRGGIGTMSPDGSEVAFVSDTTPFDLTISRTDGSDFREYQNVRMPHNNCLCWSHDKSKLVIGSMNTGSLSTPLQLFDVRSGLVHEIAKTGRITSQCWSPDNKHFVYESDERLQVYDTEKERSKDLQTKGTQATWCPDGKRIAFVDHDTYYSMDFLQTNEKQALFRKWRAESGLWWSPDSRFVAYVSQASSFEGGLLVLDSEIYWLRIRRLQDNSESRIVGAGGESYEWVTNKDLLRNAQSNTGPMHVAALRENKNQAGQHR